MDKPKNFINRNLWAILLMLGLISVAALIWRQNTLSKPLPEGAVEELRATAGLQTPTPRATAVESKAGLLPTSSPTMAPPTGTPTQIPVYYLVEPGDVPLAIAAAYSITVNSLLAANNITDPTRLQIGQELHIPVTVTPSPTAPTPTPTPSAVPSPTPEPVIHTIKSGETLSHIAAEYEVNLDLILIANDMTALDTLRVEQQLVIPANDVEFGAPTVVHKIKSGDTFSYLSFFYGSTIDDILAANPGLEPTSLQIGQKVIIPVTSPPTNPNANPGLAQIISPETMPETLADLQNGMVAAVNNQRQTRGMKLLQADEALATMALAHAQDMVARGYFAHVTPEGISLDDRFAQHNIEAYWTGENIQRNVKPIEKSVAEAIRWFMNSTPHRANILHNRFNQIGVGVAEGPPGWYTFVLVFAER